MFTKKDWKKARYCACGAKLPAKNWKRCDECKQQWTENSGDYLAMPDEIQNIYSKLHGLPFIPPTSLLP